LRPQASRALSSIPSFLDTRCGCGIRLIRLPVKPDVRTACVAATARDAYRTEIWPFADVFSSEMAKTQRGMVDIRYRIRTYSYAS
jgi:hypothetical protein